MIKSVFPKLPKIAYGGDYNPEQWPEKIWHEDVRLMREAGVNFVSLGIFSWAWIQPAADRFDFVWLDKVLDLLHANGISVNLATATASPPAWLAKKHPEMLPVTASGSILGPGGRQHYAPWSSVYRKYAAELVRQIAARYAGHPALVSWHINNEYACHVRESFDPETLALWNAWVERRYGSIEAVNEAWNTAFWSQRYESFSEISAPRLAPTIINPGMSLDWRRFSAEAFLDLVRMEKAILRQHSPHLPINTNFVGWHDLPQIDHRAIAAELDYVSWDSYPDPADGLDGIHANALCHDFMRSLKPGVPFILMEQAPSAVNWRAFNQPRSPGATRAMSHQAVARGADGVLFFQWRQSAAGGEQFHSGMVPITGIEVGGQENRVWAETKKLGRELETCEALVGSTVSAAVAILVDYESIWATEHESKPTKINVRAEITRLHRPLWERNIAVDIRHPEDDLSGYRLLLAPALMLLSERAIASLRNFVEGGGHLLFTPFCGLTDATTRIRSGGVPGGLTDLFGFALEEWWPVPPTHRGTIQMDGGPMFWTHFAELGYATDAEVLATFSDDWFVNRPAFTRRQSGRGVAWYLAARLEAEGLDSTLARILGEAKIQGVASTPRGVEASLRVAGTQKFLHLINHTNQSVEISLPGLSGHELLQNRAITNTVSLSAMGVSLIAF